MKLYYSKGSCSLSVRIIINEIGIPSEYESVNLKTKQTESGEDFFSINPKGSVPALEIKKGEVLTEAAVILQFLADHYKNQILLPFVGDMKRYRVLEWLHYTSTELHKGFSPLFNPQIPQNFKDDYLIPLLRSKLTYLNKQLTHRYLTGDQFTIADGYLYVVLSWMSIFKLNKKDWPAIEKYVNELNQRPAIQQSLKEEGLVAANA